MFSAPKESRAGGSNSSDNWVAVIERSKSLTSALEQLLAGRQIDVTAPEWPFQEAPVDKVLNSDSKCHWSVAHTDLREEHDGISRIRIEEIS